MRLVTFLFKEGASNPVPRLGALIGDGQFVLDFFSALELDERRYVGSGALLDFFDLDGELFGRANKLVKRLVTEGMDHEGLRRSIAPLRDVQLLAPVPRPGKLICIGLNYRDHAVESKMAIPKSPIIFSKFNTSVVGPDADVELPPRSEKPDYEAELALVIGRRAKRVSTDDALDNVLGYTNLNDVSERGFQFADGQWQRGKSCDTFAPMGPFIATKDEIPDPHNLGIRFRLNGETLQDSNTTQLIFNIPELISFVSDSVTLEPGDVIATGTPPGVGFARNPPVFLKPGDVMEVEVDGLGVLRNPVK